MNRLWRSVVGLAGAVVAVLFVPAVMLAAPGILLKASLELIPARGACDAVIAVHARDLTPRRGRVSRRR